MTFGEKIKKLRNENHLTQKELADQLHVTFQTVSKWENNSNEPDFSTLKELAKIFHCSIEELFNEDDEKEEKENKETKAPEVVIAGVCRDCGKELHKEDLIHNVKRKTGNGVKEKVVLCDDCYQKQEQEIDKRVNEIEHSLDSKLDSKGKGIFASIASRSDKKPLIWGIVLGIIALIVTLVICIVCYSSVGILWTICAPILVGYTLTATIYCIFVYSYISEIFLSVASWSIKFPGLIFSFDLDGLAWLIAMKILFAILGALISIGVFLLALTISAVLSFFSFIPLLIHNKTHDLGGK